MAKTFLASQPLKSRSRRLRKIRHGNANDFKKAKSVKEAVFGGSTSCPSSERGRKEVEMNRGILRGGKTAT